jgi:hypothetical protein
MVVVASAFALISTSGGTCKSYEFGANPTRGQALIHFKSTNDWRTFLQMNEFLGSRAKYTFLLPATCQIALSQTAEYVSKLNGSFESNSITLKSILSPKMLALLSTHWADTSTSLPSLFGKVSDVNPDNINIADDSSTGMATIENAANAYSSYDWHLGATSPYFSDPADFGLDHFFGIRNSITQTILAPEIKATLPNLMPTQSTAKNELNTYSEEKTSQQYDFSHEVEEQYSIKYSTGEENNNDNLSVNSADENDMDIANNNNENGDEESEETAFQPRSNQSGSTANYANSADDSLKHYLGPDATFSPMSLIPSWEKQAFSYSNSPLKMESETNIPGPYASPVGLGSGLYYSTTSNNPTADSGNGDQMNSTSDRESVSAKSRSSTILNHLVDYFKVQVNKWTGAFHRIARQIPAISGVF